MIQILQGDALAVLRTLPAASVNCCVTSPPYWGLRDYGVAGQLGLEPTPEEYVARIVEVFAEVRRVLRNDGTLWVNLGDCYAGNGGRAQANATTLHMNFRGGGKKYAGMDKLRQTLPPALKPKDLVGVPWIVAFALRADGWYLRAPIIWEKPNPMPESVKDRVTISHEYIFHLAKAEKYYYDADAIREKPTSCPEYAEKRSGSFHDHSNDLAKGQRLKALKDYTPPGGRNKRSVWTVATEPYPEAHFATYPPKLIEPCILAGCPEGGTVLDPFAGSGTTLEVAGRLGRHAIGIELNPEYIPLINKRVAQWRDQKSLFEAVNK